MTLTKPHTERMALKFLTLALLKFVDAERGNLGLALSNELYRDLEFVLKLIDGKKPKPRKVRRADD